MYTEKSLEVEGKLKEISKLRYKNLNIEKISLKHLKVVKKFNLENYFDEINAKLIFHYNLETLEVEKLKLNFNPSYELLRNKEKLNLTIQRKLRLNKAMLNPNKNPEINVGINNTEKVEKIFGENKEKLWGILLKERDWFLNEIIDKKVEANIVNSFHNALIKDEVSVEKFFDFFALSIVFFGVLIVVVSQLKLDNPFGLIISTFVVFAIIYFYYKKVK